jgi:transcriptional regulator with GAF, ATPase, and Fis domain
MSKGGRGDKTRILGRTVPELVRPKLRLEVVAGVDRGKSAVGSDKILHVGTQRGNTLQLNDDAVSRIHLEIANTPEGLRLRDLGSTNGTWLTGGARITEAVVPSGTVVQLGSSQIRLDVLAEKVSDSLSPKLGFGKMVGESAAMREVFALLERVAPTDETVLITGETGTGKELCARSIVSKSGRAQGPLVVVDCGAMPPNLLESELFGHVRGAFTGAVSEYRGAFERASGGTIFLDEIGELPLEFQTRLLRAVENRTIRQVGGSRELPLDIRIIAATNRRLEEEVNRGTFRSDLYFRLSVVQVRLPPLRERPEDVETLAVHFLREMNVGQELLRDASVLEHLRRYRWPGNARELRNYLSRLALGEPSLRSLGPGPMNLQLDDPPGGGEQDVDTSLPFKDAKEAAIARFERAYLGALLEEAAGNISQAARIAQTDRTYLSRLLVKYGLHPLNS